MRKGVPEETCVNFPAMPKNLSSDSGSDLSSLRSDFSPSRIPEEFPMAAWASSVRINGPKSEKYEAV